MPEAKLQLCDFWEKKMSGLMKRRVLVFLGLAGLAMFIFVVYSLLPAPVELCESSAGFTDGHVYLVDSSANAWAWLDNNGDGIRQSAEPWLENVCIWDSTDLDRFDEEMVATLCTSLDTRKYLVTDANGKHDGGFWAGACCDDIYIFAIPPEGYQATTPLVANGCSAEFGFVSTASMLETNQLSPTDYVLQLKMQQRQKQTLDTIKSIILVLSVFLVAVIGSFIIVHR